MESPREVGSHPPQDEAPPRPLNGAGPRASISREIYTGVLDKVFRSFLQENGRLESQRHVAPRLVEELSAVDQGKRRLLVQNSPRYQDWALAEELLAECQRGWTEDPRKAEELALLALEIAQTFRLSGFRQRLLQDLEAQAWSYIGNCRRVQSNLHESQKAFENAETCLRQGSGDLLERARLFDLKASLFAARRDYDGAKELLGLAIAAYRECRERHQEGRALLKLAKFLRDSGQVEETIPVMERAAMLLDPEVEPWLLFTAKKNLISFLVDLGRTAEAQALLPEARELAHRHCGRLERLRLLWTEGLLRQKLHQLELAEEALTQVRAGFIAAGIGYDVAQVSLDLAALYLESGRTDAVRRLAVETMPIFVSRNVQRELLVAWQLFQEAAEKDVATLRLVDEVAARIRHSEGAAAPPDAAP